MPNHLLIDNWTLQCAGTLLEAGMSGENSSELVVNDDLQGFGYRTLSADSVNVRCLFQTLSQIVFADELIVDKDSSSAWTGFPTLDLLPRERLVVQKSFAEIRNEWLPARRRFVEELCVCDEMRELHARNEATFRATRASEDPYFSQLIWGGAGMLARAHRLGIPYVGHPMRVSWFDRVNALFAPDSAQRRLHDFISEQRVKIFRRLDSGGYLARLNLPPIAAMVVQEANAVSDFLPLAIQLRREFAGLRAWLAEFQAVLDAGATGDLLRYEKTLQSAARHLEAMGTPFPVGDTTIQIGVSWLKVTLKSGDPINSAQNLFGVRAGLNKLVLAPTGNAVVRKLARLFGEEHSSLGIALEADYPRL